MDIDEVRAWFVARGHGIGAKDRLLYERIYLVVRMISRS